MKAECTWGDGPDVLVMLNGTHIMLYEYPKNYERFKHGEVSQGSLDLTSDEALLLAGELISAANSAKELDYLASNLQPPGCPQQKQEKKQEMRPEIQEMLDDIKTGKPLKIKRTKMRVPIKNGKEDWEKAEKTSKKEEKI